MMGPSSKVRFIGALVIASGVLLGILLLLNSPQALEQTQELRDPTDPGDPAPNDSTQRFVVSQQPRLVIGDDESDPRYQTVQVNGALRLSDGRLVVAENATAEIRFYDSAGSYQGSVGGRGRGPGEFEEISQIQLGGADSIYAFDRRLQRFTVFDSDGTFGRSDLVGRGDTRYNALEHLSDGAWIGKTFGKGGVGPIGSLIRDTVELILLDSDGDRLSSLGRVPGMIWANVGFPGGGRGTAPAPFAPRSHHAVLGTCVFATSADEPSVQIISAGNGKRREIRTRGRRQPVSDEIFQEWVVHRLSDVAQEEKSLARTIFSQTPRPEQLPLYNSLVVDSEGLIWLERYAAPIGSSGQWRVLDSRGEFLAEVSTAPGINVYQIGRDFLVGRVVDDLGRELVVLHSLDRPDELVDRALPECQ